MQLLEILTVAIARLAANPDLRDHARRDAELLLLHHLNINRAQLLANPTRELTEEDEFFYWQNTHRRASPEPIQYITGQQEFYGLNLRVTPAVLIPRPETEHLVEAVLQRLPHNQPLAIADIGTGSGAIAIALASHLPQARITAIDISPEALAIATANAETHHVADRIHLLQSDLLSAVTGTFDAIVSNPPYVPDHEPLHPQVRDHEPPTALFAGPQGLNIYRRLIPQARTALKPNAILALDLGHGPREAIAALLTPWHNVTFIDDLQQIPRIALASN